MNLPQALTLICSIINFILLIKIIKNVRRIKMNCTMYRRTLEIISSCTSCQKTKDIVVMTLKHIEE